MKKLNEKQLKKVDGGGVCIPSGDGGAAQTAEKKWSKKFRSSNSYLG